MAPPDVRSPADRCHGGRAQEDDLADWQIGSLPKPKLRDRQAAHLRRRFLLPVSIALAVAELHFAEARS